MSDINALQSDMPGSIKVVFRIITA